MARGAIAYKGQLYLGGSKVEANPTGSAEGGNLSKLGVDDTVYAIPQANNGTLTIQKNGTNVATFSANQSENVTANIDVSKDIAGTQTVSGNPLTLTDCAPINAESLVVELEPIQEGSGDPSTDNIRPITGYTECEVDDVGKNLVEETLVGYNVFSNGVIGSDNSFSLQVAKVKKGVTYALKKDYAGLVAGFFTSKPTTSSITYDNGRVVLESAVTIIAPIDGYIAYRTEKGYATPQCEIGSQSTTYEPYHSSKATIQFGQTVYGGKSNFTDGGTDDEWENVDLGDLSWAYWPQYERFEAHLSNVNKSMYTTDDILCSCFKPDYSPIAASGIDGTIAIFSDGTLLVICKEYTDASTFRTAMTGQTVCYKKATHATIPTPPTDLKLLQGTNNLTTNGTTINLDYIPNNSIGDAVKASEEYTDRRMDALGDLAYIDEDGDNSTKFLRGDGTWQNTPAGVTTLDDLTDTTISSPSNGQVLKYDGSKWANSADYSLPTASAGTLGGVKVGTNLSIDADGVLSATGGGGANALNDLTDVSAASPQNKQVLAYDSSQSKWVAVDADVVAIPRSYWSSTTRELDFMITVPAYNTQRILKFSLMHAAGLAASEYMFALDRGDVYSSKMAGDTCGISSSYTSSTNTYTITITMPSVSGSPNFIFAMTMYNGSEKTW